MTGIMIAAMAISGCAQKVTTSPALDEAKAAYQAVQSNPEVVQSAALELQKAEMSLAKAEEALDKNEDMAVVEHQAYLAKQHSAIALEITNQKIAEAAIDQASDERNKVLVTAEKGIAGKAMAEAAAAREKAAKLELEIAELQAVKADRGLIMTLGDVLFDVNKADLKPGGILTVEKLAAFLAEYQGRRVMIEGFTDSTGDADYNQGLSERRALAVRTALLEKGIKFDRIEFRGYGEEYPVATNDTAAGRQRNRRIEIIISDEAGVIPARMQ